ncbi:putative PEP-binding protein, partial [Streptomyces tailanensis]|uniref:putative PEP-binding protein n=1 Tax=Streptomyces tailanensis TaxID=2569858 RepID=UPI002482F6B7
AMTLLKDLRHVPDDVHLDAGDLAQLMETYKNLIHDRTGEDFPEAPAEQLRRAIQAVFRSWNGERARLYRRREHILDDLGTAVTVQRMVYGNLGADSGSGVAFTRDPATGRTGLYGDYLPNAQGEDVVAGIRNTAPLAELERLDARSYRQLRDHMRTLESHYRDLCDIEFTIERGRLWMLQTRVGKRTAEAAFAIAAELVDEGLITPAEGLARVSGEGLARLMFPRFDASATGQALAHGIAASPGAAVGAVVFDSAEARGTLPDPRDTELLGAVNRMHEDNPMLGLRGVRLGLVIPGLVAMQVRAIAEAVVERTRAGGSPEAEIMVRLVGAVEELRLARAEVERVLAEVSEESGVAVHCPVGTMIELPRAALTADRIAEEAEFFSFGTNDLTETTWGFSRDDVEAAFFSVYLDKGVFPASPFETLDRQGVGRLVGIAVAEGRAARPDLKIGVCGEHGGDPDSVHFFHGTGLDYVSCSPFRVPVARLEAGRAALPGTDGSDSR